jgi:hypothetical protein
LTQGPGDDLSIAVGQHNGQQWTSDEVKEFVAWFDDHAQTLPGFVRGRLKSLRDFLVAHPDPTMYTRSQSAMLLRAMGFIASSEKRASGRPLASIPRKTTGSAQDKRAKEEQSRDRSLSLSDWHSRLSARHQDKAKRLEKRLAKMPPETATAEEQPCDADEQEITEQTPVEQIKLTAEQEAAAAAGAVKFVEHLELGDGFDPTLASSNETLMPGGTVLHREKQETLPVELPEELADATVVKTLKDERVRYDFSMQVTRIKLNVEKKVVVDSNGNRHVVAASTSAYGPPRYGVTWGALATLTVMVGQYAIPFNRLATMLSTAGKRFTAGILSRMLHFVAVRLLPIYLELAKQMAASDIFSGDDTRCRVLEVASHFAKAKKADGSSEKKKPPWVEYATPEAAEKSIRRCEQRKKERQKRRADGDRKAKRTADEDPSLGVLIGRALPFESPRRDGKGPKQSLNTTVISARSVADDPQSLIIFYRSHLGGYGNLLEAILGHRRPTAMDVFMQGDLGSANLVTCPDLLSRFRFHTVGCSAHARRPFALYEHEDPVNCSHMLHLFLGLAIHERCLDDHGRNRQNVLAVRDDESRQVWSQIKDLARKMKRKWSKSTKLGKAVRYILKHFAKLTAHLNDPRLEPSNNLRERMLRLEKLIERGSMFRRSLEGRFVLDVIRTILQTAVAADVPVHAYLVSVLRADPDDVAQHPESFTPHAWAARHAKENPQPE